MEMKVTSDKVLDTAVFLSQKESLPFDLWHQVITFIIEKPKLKNYIIINNQVIHITPQVDSMTPIRLFKKKELLTKMHHKTFGNKLQDSRIAFDIFHRRKTIEEVLAL